MWNGLGRLRLTRGGGSVSGGGRCCGCRRCGGSGEVDLDGSSFRVITTS